MPRKVDLINTDATYQVGEVRQDNGLLSMCLGERSYGGGSGTIWATPGETVEFTVTTIDHHGYFLGICQSIYPRRKSVSLLILEGLTWGDFKTGNAIEIKADSIHRFHKTDRFDGLPMTALARQAQSSVYEDELFRQITLKELKDACREEQANLFKGVLGRKAYEKSEEFIRAYLEFAKSLRSTAADSRQQLSKKTLSSARRVRNLLGMDGRTIALSDNEVVPSELSPSQSAGFGAVIGALVGDAAGGVLEFLGRRPTRTDIDKALNMPGGGVFGLAPGQITDDGELTLCLLRALAEKEGTYDPSLVARYYNDWAESNPFDIGMTTANALKVKGTQVMDPAAVIAQAALENNMESKANGALMRVTPLAVASAKFSEEQAIEWARADAAMTHPNSSCLDANAAYVLAIRHMVLNPGDSRGAVRAAREYLSQLKSEVKEWLDEAIEGTLPAAHPQAGYVRIAFTYAFYHLDQRSPLRSALSETLLQGGDTDTNACIVGGLIGAYRGATKMMEQEGLRRMVGPVLMCDPSLGQDRPDVYHASSAGYWLPKIF